MQYSRSFRGLILIHKIVFKKKKNIALNLSHFEISTLRCSIIRVGGGGKILSLHIRGKFGDPRAGLSTHHGRYIPDKTVGVDNRWYLFWEEAGAAAFLPLYHGTITIVSLAG